MRQSILFLLCLCAWGASAQSAGQDTTLLLTENIYFDFGKDHIRPEGAAQLNQLVARLPADFTGYIRLSAHTDSIGNNGDNHALSERRANSVIQHLVRHPLPQLRFVTQHDGELQPVADNGSASGRQLNRRVEVAVYQVNGIADLVEKRPEPKPVPQSKPQVEPETQPQPEPVPSTPSKPAPKPGQSGIMFLVIDAQTKKPIQAEIVYREGKTGPENSLTADANGKEQVIFKQHKYRELRLDCYAKGYFHFTDDVSIAPGTVAKVKIELQPVKVGTKIALKNLYFYGNRADLRPGSAPELVKLKKSLEMNPGVRIQIGGHINYPFTRPEDVPEWSRQLSVRRAKMVYDYLVENGIPAEDLEYKGYSNTQMVYPYARTPQHQAANMRVELMVIE